MGTFSQHKTSIVERLEPRRLLSAVLLKDINTATNDSDPGEAVAVGNTVYFLTIEGLWKTDGTTDGTQPVNLGLPARSQPDNLAAIGNELIFFARDGQNNLSVWGSNGTAAGTQSLATFPNTYDVGYPVTVAAGEKLFITFSDGVKPLWVTDGTASGTVELTGASNSAGMGVADITRVGNRVFFAAGNLAANGPALWTSDGTTAGTTMVRDFALNTVLVDPPANLAALGMGVVFTATDAAATDALWVSDGTAQGTTEIAAPMSVSDMTSIGTSAVFRAGGAQGVELWKTDGTTAGTGLLDDLLPGPASSYPYEFVANGDTAYFLAATDTDVGLWKTDGTADGTVRSMAFPSRLDDLTVAGHNLFFFAGSSGYNAIGEYPGQLWESDGTPAGTRMICSATPQPTSANGFTPVGSNLFFAADDGVHGMEPWITDGSLQGTHLLLDINTTPASSRPAHFTTIGGHTFFTAVQGSGTERLWVTDGTPQGTVSLTNDPNADPEPSLLTNVDGTLYFVANDAAHGRELWRSDGTPAGTFMVADLTPGPENSVFSGMLAFNHQLYFALKDSQFQWHMFRSDGTPGGTVSLFVLPSAPVQMIDLGGTLLVSAFGSLYSMNAAQTGLTTLGPGVSGASGVISAGSFYYLAQVRISNLIHTELYRSDGTVANTIVVSDLGLERPQFQSMVAAGGLVYFVLRDSAGTALWRSDGTATGTFRVQALSYGSSWLNGTNLVAIGQTLYFFTFDSNYDDQLWTTNGSTAGTTLVTTIPTGWLYSDAPVMASADGFLYFVAENGVNGARLWESDGTPAGTEIVDDPARTTLTPSLNVLFASAGQLFLSADDGTHGFQPWALGLTGTITARVFNDTNYDGVLDETESGLAGVTTYLDANGNGQLDPGEMSAVTGPDGSCSFSGLTPGAYSIRELLAPAWARTTPGSASEVLIVRPAESSVGPAFGNVRIGTVAMDFAYLLTLAEHYQSPGTFATGDLNGDDFVDFSDLLLLAQNYGHPLSPTGPQGPMSAAVNHYEPTSTSAIDDALWLHRRRKPVG